MNHKKKAMGFTLIELLAVIIVLAVLALVATPIIIRIIENSRQNVFKSSVDGLIRTVQVDANNNSYTGDFYSIEKGNITNSNGEKIKGKGGSDENGAIILNKDGEISAVIYNKTWCAKKSSSDKQTTITKYNADTCRTDTLAPNLVTTIKNKNTSGNSEGLFTDNNNNIRYRGSNDEVKNYVTFNHEKWRIVGIIRSHVKLIREESIGLYAWDSSGTGYKNNWAESSLMRLLNEGYDTEANSNSLYWNGKSGKCYTSRKDAYGYGSSALADCDFTGMELNAKAKSMIQTVTYVFGKPNHSDYKTGDIYEMELHSSATVTNPSWAGDIIPMYASDYGYAARSTCSKNLYGFDEDINCTQGNWLFKGFAEWTATSFSSSDYEVAAIAEKGNLPGGVTMNYSASSLNVRPTLFLKTNVVVIEGTGTKEDPYVLF